MYENEYENYMRSVLGYPTNNTYNINSFPYKSNNNVKDNYEHLYPDIYNVLKPMVKKVCSNVRSMDISSETIEDMANEIYNNIESDTTNITIAGTENSVKSNEMEVRGKSNKNTEESSRGCCGNPTLKDLIKILIITQLIGNSNNRPPKPPPPSPYPPRPNYRDFEDPSFYDNNFYRGF